MKKLASPPRHDWQAKCEAVGFPHHTSDVGVYWDESSCYEFRSHQIDAIELATEKLQEMCMKLVQNVIDEKQYALFRIPEHYHGWIEESWNNDQRQIYGRFDLAYDGVNPPKLLEYNADTPTSLVESAVVQWYWLQDCHPQADQFNSIHERLIEAWQELRNESANPIHFASLHNNAEDAATTDYIMDTAIQAGFKTARLNMGDISWNSTNRLFVDRMNRPIRRIFKLYPWEWMFRERFGQHLTQTNTLWYEPPWKTILSCKSILPLLYQMFPDSEYLLPAAFEPLEVDHVRKPIHGREGANVEVVRRGSVVYKTEGEYDETFSVYQQIANMPVFSGRTPVIGSWVVNGVACGMGIREDDTMITTNRSRFIPHYFTE